MSRRLFPLIALLAALAGCAAPAPTPAPQFEPAPASVERFAWRILRGGDAERILADLPADPQGAEAPPAPADPAALAAWADPEARWLDAEMRASALDGQGPAEAEAARTLLADSMADGLELARLARSRARAISDDAVLAEIAWRVIAHSHPLRADAARAEAGAAAWAGLWRGHASPPDVIAGRLLGAAVATAAIQTGGPEHLAQGHIGERPKVQ